MLRLDVYKRASIKGTEMDRPNQTKRTLTTLMVLTIVSTACGGSGDGAESALDQPEIETTTTNVSETSPTTTAPPIAADGPVKITSSINSLTPGVTYVTETDVPFSFSVTASELEWWPVVTEDWSVSMVFGEIVGGELVGPQLSLGVAEPGATSESVVTAMTTSAESIDFQVSEGLFGGRNAVVLDGSFEDRVIPRPGRILTGENSWIEFIFEQGRSYRSHVFEDGGRVFVVSVEADPDDMPVVLAEAASVFESLEIGDPE